MDALLTTMAHTTRLIGPLFSLYGACFRCDELGRKATILCAAVPFFMAWIIIAVTENYLFMVGTVNLALICCCGFTHYEAQRRSIVGISQWFAAA